MRKKKIVETDRAKLVQIMVELDEKKKNTLLIACEQVNKDFGSIFSTLLPGAQARLTPPPGRTVLEGLEVKVGFNNSWKESLGELSGGQRSLVALSLVLAMLLFKPAPLYILDEVDAALDLSHTQNIGQMLKNHFTHSQVHSARCQTTRSIIVLPFAIVIDQSRFAIILLILLAKINYSNI